MPGYAGTGQAKLIRQSQQIFLFQREVVPVGSPSIALKLESLPYSFYSRGASLQLFFTDANGNPANPGAFEVDIQSSDADQDAFYGAVAELNGNLNANFVTRIDIPNFYAKYVRGFVKTLTNAVYVSLLCSH